MKVIEITDKAGLKDLYDSWAMTWEGLSEDSFGDALEYCCREGRDGTIYKMTGKTMNGLCGLTGSNAYPDDLTIACIKDYKGLAMQYGARWMTDIVDNNLDREGKSAADVF